MLMGRRSEAPSGLQEEELRGQKDYLRVAKV